MFASPLRIRNYRKEDFEALHRIDRICFPHDIAFSPGDLDAYLNHPASIARVAEDPSRILGFVLAHIEAPSHAHILTLDVVPEARHQRIGASLMDALHKELGIRGVGAAVLEVGVLNVAAQRLYENLRYRYLGVISGYYGHREDAYRMVRLFVRDTEARDNPAS
jgi:ribosomal protein S18 acetylase RimI-like enzyme